MVRYVPTQLPDAFRWVEQRDGTVLTYKENAVLRVSPQKQGWLIEVLIPDSRAQPQRLLTRSRNVGMCWGSKWAKARILRFEQVIADLPVPKPVHRQVLTPS